MNKRFILLFVLQALLMERCCLAGEFSDFLKSATKVFNKLVQLKKKVQRPAFVRQAEQFPFDQQIYEYCQEQDLLESQLKLYVPKEERQIVVVIPSYNNAQHYKRNLASVYGQDYKNYSVVYVDDASPDGTGDLCEQYIKEMKQEYRTILIKNAKNQGAMANLYAVINSCDSQAIIVNLDGDDSLAKKSALSLVNKVYDKFQVLLTYGSYQEYFYKGKPGLHSYKIPEHIVQARAYRAVKIFPLSHLRTYKAFLFQAIAKSDLMHEGKFFDTASDLAMMYPMAEMAGSRIMYIPDVLYLYNTTTSLNDYKLKQKRQGMCSGIIRERSTYPVIV